MKADVLGMRSLIYYTASLFDRAACAKDDPGEREYWQGLIDLLTPMVKAYCSELGFDVCVEAMQVFGGYGYTREYPIEQLVRDSKIATIYEGTNGIQAMDLLGRKLGMKKGAVFLAYLGEIRKTIAAADCVENLAPLARRLEKAIGRLADTAFHLGQTAASPGFREAFSHAHPFLEIMGDVTMAWMLLWRAVAAQRQLDGRDETGERETAFYAGQVRTAEYHIRSRLPVTLGKMEAILDGCPAAVEMTVEEF